MRLLIAFTILGASFLCAYIRYLSLKKALAYNSFYLELSKELIHNNLSEMKPFNLVFCDVYQKNIDEIAPDTTENLLIFAQKSLNIAVNNTEILNLFKKYITYGAAEIHAASNELVEVCENAFKSAKKHLKERGKSALALYPGAAALMLIILI